MQKYEFTDETSTYQGHILHRIKAVIDFGKVKAGDLGGWIETEYNLSHYGLCWVADDAIVFDNARVCGNALASGRSKIYGDAWVCGNAEVKNYAEVFDHATVMYYAKVFDNAEVFEYAEIRGTSEVCERAQVFGHTQIFGDAVIKEMGDYMVFQNTWSSGRWFTWTRSNNMWRVGCFYGTGDELIKKAYRDSEKSGKCYETIVKAVETLSKC